MRHRISRLQLNRFTSWRKATLKSLARNLITYQSIRTSLHKAKAVRPLVEKLISLAKRNTLTAKRQAFKILGDHKIVSQLFKEIGPRFVKVHSGYTRIINLERRRGDNAELAILELTEIKKKEIRKPKKEKEARGQQVKEEKSEVTPALAKEEQKPKTEAAVKEKPPISKKPSKNFLGGLRNIFKKERDSL